jgi:hypothetical protein
MQGIPLHKWPAVYTFDLADGLQIAFGAVPQLPDAVLMQYLVNFTCPWNGVEYGTPWQIYLEAKPWRRSDTGEIVVSATPSYPGDGNPHALNPRVPMNSGQARDFTISLGEKDISRTLKFGRDNEWPLVISCASTLDGSNSATITYESSWENRENTVDWFWTKFLTLMEADGMEGLPVASRLSAIWQTTCRIEDYAIRVTLHEKTSAGEFVPTPEDDGIPCFLLYGPRATIKMRCESIAVANQFLTMFYGREPTQVSQFFTREWALIASIDGGIIPLKHKAVRNQEIPVADDLVWNKEIFDAGLVTQPYSAGLGKFTAKFKPRRPYSATIAIEKGCHNEHGTAFFFEQESRRCLLTQTLYGLTDDEVLWYTMQAWASFQPRLAKPRQDPGLLYYPAEYTHVFQKYWDYLNNPVSHPDCSETDHTKNSMSRMASAIASMSLSLWEPQVDAEAPDKSSRVAHKAALSRKCPIQDAANYWLPVESQVETATASGSPALAQDRHNVDT